MSDSTAIAISSLVVRLDALGLGTFGLFQSFKLTETASYTASIRSSFLFLALSSCLSSLILSVLSACICLLSASASNLSMSFVSVVPQVPLDNF